MCIFKIVVYADTYTSKQLTIVDVHDLSIEEFHCMESDPYARPLADTYQHDEKVVHLPVGKNAPFFPSGHLAWAFQRLDEKFTYQLTIRNILMSLEGCLLG